LLKSQGQISSLTFSSSLAGRGEVQSFRVVNDSVSVRPYWL
jgi:hypothetical protein